MFHLRDFVYELAQRDNLVKYSDALSASNCENSNSKLQSIYWNLQNPTERLAIKDSL